MNKLMKSTVPSFSGVPQSQNASQFAGTLTGFCITFRRAWNAFGTLFPSRYLRATTGAKERGVAGRPTSTALVGASDPLRTQASDAPAHPTQCPVFGVDTPALGVAGKPWPA